LGDGVSVERIIELELGREIRGALCGAVIGHVVGGPWWAVVLAAPGLSLVFLCIAEELSEHRLSTFSLALLGAMIAVVT
jgi:hypothetical protein